ncbi:MAG: PD-(D/E)XK nuclease family protein [Phycisphaerales bacterium]|jgi:hypothetical protein|nr:PD-(D/E)XK nuclease family protein [Phycisphaerales bacterium]
MPTSEREGGGAEGAAIGAPATRIEFLGWEHPALASAVERLGAMSSRPDEMDLSRVLVVTPNARTGRLLLAALIEHAEARGVALSPPRTITPGEVAPMLLRDALPRHRRPAGSLTRRLVWTRALCETTPALRHAIAPGLANAEDGAPDPRAWGGVAAMLLRASDELAGALHDFRSATRVLATRPDFPDRERFEACDFVARDASLRLARAGMYDETTTLAALLREPAREDASSRGTGVSRTEAVLLGVTELPLLARRALHAHANVHAFVFAPGEHRTGFDEFGLINQEYWSAFDPDAPAECLRVCATPGDACDCALELLAELPAGTSTENIVIAAPDAELGDMLVSHAALTGAVELRPASGTRVASTPPGALLPLLADAARHDTLGSYGALARHPDVGRSLGTASLVPQIDRLGARSMPSSLAALRSIAIEDGLARGLSRLDDLVTPLRAALRPACEWTDELRRVLERVYAGQHADARIPEEARSLGALGAIAESLDELGALSPELAPIVSGADAAVLVAEAAGERSLPEEAMPEAVEVLGWLEVLLDPAPHAIVLGLHEGSVPGPRALDPLLPESVRRSLGISTRDERFARDAYLLHALVRSRHAMGGTLRIISNSRGVGGDSCVPSRLLLRGDDACASERLVQLVHHLAHPHHPRHVRGRREPGVADGFPDVRVRPAGLACPALERVIDAMRVTWFGVYLRSPYEFYTSHVLGLDEAEVASDELQPRRFGTLLHDVLSTLTDPDVAACADAQRVRDFLLDHLSLIASRQFGSFPAPAVSLQLDAARARLSKFAEMHAERARSGWRVLLTEWSPTDTPDVRPAIVVDGESMGLIGTIDRIDVNDASGRLGVFDYKTANDATTPEQAHRRDSAWRDLQLPLYRELVRASEHALLDTGAPRLDLDDPETITLGYAVLPRDVAQTQFLAASWHGDDLAAAIECAQSVVRRVRQREFFAPGEHPPEVGPIASMLRTGPVAIPEGER